jgi:2-dehydropantoate 2-reductase
MEKHVYIIGAGAIGKALAVFLQLNQQKVTLLRGSVDNGAHSLEKVSVAFESKILETEIEISSLSNFRKLDGIIVLSSKSFGNENLAQVLSTKTGKSPVILLQNGLGVEQAFIDRDFPEIYRCVLFVTSQVMESGEVRFKPVADCPIGTVKGTGLLLTEVIQTLNTSWFRFVDEPNIQTVIWKKAIVNSVFNSVCPLLDIDNGIFHRDTNALELAGRIITECLLVATEKGILLSKDEVLESLLRISRFSDGQLISTLQDIRLGRRTEIGTLNGAIVTIATKLNMAHLVPETRLLWEMTRLKEGLNRKIE